MRKHRGGPKTRQIGSTKLTEFIPPKRRRGENNKDYTKRAVRAFQRAPSPVVAPEDLADFLVAEAKRGNL